MSSIVNKYKKYSELVTLELGLSSFYITTTGKLFASAFNPIPPEDIPKLIAWLTKVYQEDNDE